MKRCLFDKAKEPIYNSLPTRHSDWDVKLKPCKRCNLEIVIGYPRNCAQDARSNFVDNKIQIPNPGAVGANSANTLKTFVTRFIGFGENLDLHV